MGLSGPAAQYEYTSPFMTPDTSMALVKANYVGGVRPDYLAFKMPPPPAPDDGIDRTQFIDTPVGVPGGLAFARVRFGYAENGSPDQFYCTSRREACLTDAQVAPFAFAQTDAGTGQGCGGGCTVHIPAISGRVLYYRVERSDDGTSWVNGDMQVVAIR